MSSISIAWVGLSAIKRKSSKNPACFAGTLLLFMFFLLPARISNAGVIKLVDFTAPDIAYRTYAQLTGLYYDCATSGACLGIHQSLWDERCREANIVGGPYSCDHVEVRMTVIGPGPNNSNVFGTIAKYFFGAPPGTVPNVPADIEADSIVPVVNCPSSIGWRVIDGAGNNNLNSNSVLCLRERTVYETNPPVGGAGPGGGGPGSGGPGGGGPGGDGPGGDGPGGDGPGGGGGPDGPPSKDSPSGGGGCDKAEPPVSFGNPISASLGLKEQIESVYRDPRGALSFYFQYQSNNNAFGFALLPVFTHNFDIRLMLPKSVPAVPESFNFAVVRRFKKTAIFDSTTMTSITPDNTSLLAAVPVSGGNEWVFTDRSSGEILLFDSAGRLKSKSHSGGQRVTLTYSVAGDTGYPVEGLLKKITDQFGREIQLTYSQQAKLLGITDPSGQQYSFAYDGASANCSNCGLLSSITFPDSTQRLFHFNEAANNPSTDQSLLTGVTNQLGVRESTFKYYASGLAQSTERAGGVYKYQFDYISYMNSTKITNPLGTDFVQSYSFDAGGIRFNSVDQPAGAGCPLASRSVSRDANFNISTAYNLLGVPTSYTYDLARNVELSRKDSAGQPNERVISKQWHPHWDLVVREAAPKQIASFIYNGQPDPTNSNALSSCVPASAPALPNSKVIARLCKVVLQATSDLTGNNAFAAVPVGVPRVWSYTYDSDGQLITAKAPRVDLVSQVTYEYYASNDVALPKKWTRGDLKKSTSAVGHITTFDKYDPSGRLLQLTNPVGAVSAFTYSPRGWLTSSVATSGGTSLSRTNEYWATGKVKKSTGTDGSFISYEYDPAQRLFKVTDSSGAKIVYSRDGLGNPMTEEYVDSVGVTRHKILRGYDALGRLQSVTGVR